MRGERGPPVTETLGTSDVNIVSPVDKWDELTEGLNAQEREIVTRLYRHDEPIRRVARDLGYTSDEAFTERVNSILTMLRGRLS